MDTALTPQFLARLAELSRLHPDEALANQLGNDLRRILHAIESLEDCAVGSQGEVVRGPTGDSGGLREDVPTPCLSVDEALAMAPDRMGDGFAVPQIMAAPGERASS